MAIPSHGVIKMYHPYQHLNSASAKVSLDSSVTNDFAHDLPAELLEKGWRKMMSRREKRTYYFNKNTEESLWEMPVLNARPTVKAIATYTDESNKRNTEEPEKATTTFTSTSNKRNVKEPDGGLMRFNSTSPNPSIEETEKATSTYTSKSKKLHIEEPDASMMYTSTYNKRNVEESEATEKAEIKDIKKSKTDTYIKVEVMDTYNVVKGAMLEVVKNKVIDCLNYLCPIQSLHQDDEHFCMGNLLEDIIFCHVGLIQKYHIAYSLMKREVGATVKEKGDEKGRSKLIDLIFQAIVNHGMQPSEAQQYCSIDMLCEMIGHSEIYSEVFEQLRARLLSIQLCQKKQDGNKAVGNYSCLRSNFGLLHI